MTSIIAGRRTAWLFALLPILLAAALIGGLGEAEHTTDSRDNLPENADSTAAAFLLDDLPDEATEAAIVLWTADSGTLSEDALGAIKEQPEGALVPSGTAPRSSRSSRSRAATPTRSVRRSTRCATSCAPTRRTGSRSA